MYDVVTESLSEPTGHLQVIPRDTSLLSEGSERPQGCTFTSLTWCIDCANIDTTGQHRYIAHCTFLSLSFELRRQCSMSCVSMLCVCLCCVYIYVMQGNPPSVPAMTETEVYDRVASSMSCVSMLSSCIYVVCISMLCRATLRQCQLWQRPRSMTEWRGCSRISLIYSLSLDSFYQTPGAEWHHRAPPRSVSAWFSW